MITASTFRKERLFDTPDKLTLLEDTLLTTLDELGWSVQAWAVFPNHYHFVGHSPESGLGLEDLTQRVHRNSARELNRIDGKAGRKVWFQCWDSALTFERSYMARLAYVHFNPVRHGLVAEPRMYQWCSAQWFEARGHPPFVETILGFPHDKVNIYDEF